MWSPFINPRGFKSFFYDSFISSDQSLKVLSFVTLTAFQCSFIKVNSTEIVHVVLKRWSTAFLGSGTRLCPDRGGKHYLLPAVKILLFYHFSAVDPPTWLWKCFKGWSDSRLQWFSGKRQKKHWVNGLVTKNDLMLSFFKTHLTALHCLDQQPPLHTLLSVLSCPSSILCSPRLLPRVVPSSHLYKSPFEPCFPNTLLKFL